jgi:polyhydroxyalkanoate synthesis regulator phasin
MDGPMTEEKNADADGKEEKQARSGKMGDGFKQGMGVLTAFKDALEETIQEARDRGDLSSERAKEVVKDALDRAQSAAEGARDRLDFVPQADMDALKSAVDSMRDRVSALEKQVFGEARTEEASGAKGEESGPDSGGDTSGS